MDRLEEFWSAVWDYFGVRSATPYERVLSGSVMPDVQWFTGAQVSYVEHLFRARISAPVLRPLGQANSKWSWRPSHQGTVVSAGRSAPRRTGE